MAITLDGTNGITTPAVTNNGAYTGDGVVFADGTPSNTLVTTTGGNVGIGTNSTPYVLQVQKNSTQLWTDCQSSYVEQSLTLSSGSNIDWYQSTKGTGAFIWRQAGTTERMRIDSSGNLLVGTTSAFFGSRFEVQAAASGSEVASFKWGSGATFGNARFINGSNTTIGFIQWAGSSTSYNTSSDYRLKENIAPMTGALATVAQLKPVTYTWKADGSSGQGFIAHELQEVVPDAVTGEKDAVNQDGSIKPQGIDTSFLVATLTAAIQEQQAIITDLKARIETLENK